MFLDVLCVCGLSWHLENSGFFSGARFLNCLSSKHGVLVLGIAIAPILHKWFENKMPSKLRKWLAITVLSLWHLELVLPNFAFAFFATMAPQWSNQMCSRWALQPKMRMGHECIVYSNRLWTSTVFRMAFLLKTMERWSYYIVISDWTLKSWRCHQLHQFPWPVPRIWILFLIFFLHADWRRPTPSEIPEVLY